MTAEGGHQGPTKLPQEESDPRIEIEGDPNFYYAQEDSLWKYCAGSGGQTGWNICMPGPILGAVPDAAMNLAFPLAVYAAVTKQLGEVLKWPGDVVGFQSDHSMSSSMMNGTVSPTLTMPHTLALTLIDMHSHTIHKHTYYQRLTKSTAYMEEWSVLNPAAHNQKFNTFDGGDFTYESFWPRLAGWYGLSWTGPSDDPSTQYTERELPHNPRGYGPKVVSRRTFSMVDWAKQPKVQEAWKKLAEEHDLSQKELVDVDRVFGFADGSLVRGSSLMFR